MALEGGGGFVRSPGKGDKRLREIIHKHRRAFAHSGDCVFVYLRVGREHAFCQALNHRSGEGEILYGALANRKEASRGKGEGGRARVEEEHFVLLC